MQYLSKGRFDPSPGGTIRPVILWTVAGLLAVPLLDALVFRSGWYLQWLEPNSSAGSVEAPFYWLTHAAPPSRPEVIVFGDSRIAHALSAPIAEAASGQQMRFWNFGISGTLPRDWYYILRDADPTRRRFSAVVLALDQYSDEDYIDVYADRIIDLNFLIGRLRITDCPEFALSMKSWPNRRRAFEGCMLKGLALQSDIAGLLTNWQDRVSRANDFRRDGLKAINSFAGIDSDLSGLSADWEHQTIAFPPGLDQPSRRSIQATVMPTWPPHTGETTRYRQRWVTRIFDLYKESSTKVILIELPRAPLPKPEAATPSSFLDSALPRAGVIALDRATFRDLERPQYFFDGLHLNRQGRAIFSSRIGQLLPAL